MLFVMTARRVLFVLLVTLCNSFSGGETLTRHLKHDVEMPRQGLAFRYQKASYENITLILFADGGNVVIAISRASLLLTPTII